jgi:pilus assembly protein CpaE
MFLAAFAADEETRAVMANAAETDWPGAAVELGGVEAAAAFLRNGEVPDILVVDLGDSEKPYEDLIALSEFCDPATQVVAVGSINDLTLYRRIVGAGVSDYLVKPLIPDDLSSALTTAAENKPDPNASMSDTSKTVMVIGARGGIGASTIAANGAWMMAELFGKKTVLLDLDVQFGTSALSMDVLPAGGLVEALQHPERVDSLFMASALTPKTKRPRRVRKYAGVVVRIVRVDLDRRAKIDPRQRWRQPRATPADIDRV